MRKDFRHEVIAMHLDEVVKLIDDDIRDGPSDGSGGMKLVRFKTECGAVADWFRVVPKRKETTCTDEAQQG